MPESIAYRNLKKIELISLLKLRNLRYAGNKKELIRRLRRSDDTRSKCNGFSSSSKMPNGELHQRKRNGHLSTEFENSSSIKLVKGTLQKADVVLWKHPIITLKYFFMELYIKLIIFLQKLVEYKVTVSLLFIITICSIVICSIDGSHQKYVTYISTEVRWSLYWIGLGFLSSVGLGTGLHTFLLYLGPHIASVTLAAFECMSLDFPSPPYPTEIICPSTESSIPITIWSIMSKVRLEAFMWGAGTALGELPPYFMAKTARLSGGDIDEELEELHEIRRTANENRASLSLWTRAKLSVENLVERVGFFGILICASIPNPLFDLAGITCGYLLVPFTTFFGATLIGKAVIKMHIQKLFVIMSFSQHHAEIFVDIIGKIPHIGPKMQKPFQDYFSKQKAKLHSSNKSVPIDSDNWISWIFNNFVICMVIYFLLSIINSMAQNYYLRIDKEVKQRSK